MKKFLTLAALVTIACAAVLSSCKKDDPVPVVSITTQPTAPAALTEGSITGSLTVGATATEGATPTYQWYTNTSASNTGGTAVSGATAKTFTLPTTLAAGTYYYFCEVGADGAKPVRTNAVTVTVNAKPAPVPVITITTQPTAPADITEGSIAADTKLTVAATATEGAVLKYQWYSYDPETEELFEAIEGATSASYTLPTDLAAGSHYYVCEITAEGAASVQTDPVTVTVKAKEGELEPTYTISASTLTSFGSREEGYTQPAAQTVTITNTGTGTVTLAKPTSTNYTIGDLSVTELAAGAKATFTVQPKSGLTSGSKNETITINGTGGGAAITPATVSAQFSVTAPAPQPVYVAVTGITGVPTAATVGVTLTLTGTIAPSNATNKAITWSVKTDGGTGVSITGGNKLNATAAGTVTVTAAIANGETETTPYTQDFDIAVTAPVISIAPAGQPAATTNVTQGGITGTLSVAANATGGATLSYQWYTNTSASNEGGTEISGATSASYTIPTTLTADGGPYYYYCVVSVTGGDPVASAVATVNVAHSYSINVTPTTLPFGSLVAPYTQPAAQTVTITNTGTGAVTLTAPTATNYALGTISPTELAAGATATFTVQPKPDLAVGTYNETIAVTASNGVAPVDIAAQFKVTTAPTLVSTAALTGVISPVAGAAPSQAINDGTGFTAELVWDSAPDLFDYSTAYTATVTLTVAEGYTFDGGFADLSAISGFTVNTFVPTSFVENTGTTLKFTVAFPETEEAPDDDIDITYGPGDDDDDWTNQ